jgi:hypothetical protein
MDDFFPFIHERKKKKEWEPEPLYVELIPPPPEKTQEVEPESPTVIIIRL